MASSDAPSTAAPAVPPGPPISFSRIMERSANKALNGGLAGAAAMGVQVTSLMWLRTAMNYQYRHGGGVLETVRTLYAEGGVPRFYRGLQFALVQGPVARFGDTAANQGVNAMFDEYRPSTHILVRTGCASMTAGLLRIVMTPVDTCKTMLQVEGAKGLGVLATKIRLGGPSMAFHGAIGNAMATMVGHFPWFTTFNTLQEHLPGKDGTFTEKIIRNAVSGFSSSVASDITSNSIRVLKTYRQTSHVPVSYWAAFQAIAQKDGIQGVFLRGLQTRLLVNGLNGICFAVVWKMLLPE